MEMNAVRTGDMLRRLTLALAFLLVAPAGAYGGTRSVSIFYYPWYGTPGHDGAYLHWEQDGHLPPADLASSYYPARGPYSSGDEAVVKAQMAEIA